MTTEDRFFDTTIKGDGLTYYIVPANTLLFRGDIPKKENMSIEGHTPVKDPTQINYDDPVAHVTGPVFFAVNEDTARKYGIPFQFTTNKELHVLALDKSMNTIYEIVSKDTSSINEAGMAKDIIPPILENNYGCKNGKRNSNNEKDKILTNYLCGKYPSGYALDYTNTDGEGKFHREIILCNKNDVSYDKNNQIKISKAEEDAILEEQRMRITEQRRVETGKTNQNNDNDQNNDYDQNNIIKKLEFSGGKKTVRKRTRKINRKDSKKKVRKSKRKTSKSVKQRRTNKKKVLE